MARDFPIRADLLRIGLPERTVRVLEKVELLIEALQRITATEGDISTINDATDALNEAIEDANLSLTSLDARLDVVEAFTNTDPRYVRRDQTSAWTAATGTGVRTALASYAGQTVSNPPTQAEVQALDDAVKAISQHVVQLINDLRGIDVLT